MKSFWLEKDICTGCAACMNACPVNAISMQADAYGFLQPSISDACIDCDSCEKVCFGRYGQCQESSFEPEVVAAVSRDEDVRFESTSGGAFHSFASAVISEGGGAFGAVYDEANDVVHSVADDQDSLRKLMQSKYVQSDIGFTFREVKKRLEAGRSVVFCGAPCQVAGLRAFLKGDHERLLLIDFICRGVNSPKAYRSWLRELEQAEGSSVSRVWFKYKKGGWKSSPRRTRIDFQNGNHVILDQGRNLYMEGYLGSNLFMRPCCGSCEFKGFPRMGDVTLADFWGLESHLDDDKGTSMLLLNNDKGRKAFDRLSGCFRFEIQDFKSIFKGNVCILDSAKVNPRSKDFLTALDFMDFSEAVRKFGSTSLLKKVKRRLRKMLS